VQLTSEEVARMIGGVDLTSTTKRKQQSKQAAKKKIRHQ
jgi:hypothetical protein